MVRNGSPLTNGHQSGQRADYATRFQPGNKMSKGRPNGSRHKLGEQFLSKMQADFVLHGEGVIEKVRQTEPAQYLRIIASLMPKEMDVKTSKSLAEELSDEELEYVIDILSKRAELSGEHVVAADDEAPN